MSFLSERREDRQRQREIDEALRLLKLPWHSVFSHDKINHPGKRRAGKWQRYRNGVKK